MNKEMIKNILLNIPREGMKELVSHLDEIGFFKAPASTKYHGNYEGGLIDHCWNVFHLFGCFNLQYKLDLKYDTVAIVSLLHDVCKSQLYIKTENGYEFNKEVGDKGHGKYSLEIIKKFIKLTEIEEQIIKYHMGMYMTIEFAAGYGEYALSHLRDAFNNHAVKLFYFCDDIVAQCIDKTTEEK